jgi:hypothetical protein
MEKTMTEHDINFMGSDTEGKYYDLDEDAPIDGVIVNEFDRTVTLCNDRTEQLESVTKQLMALERDRLLGFRESKLHRDPKTVIEDAVEELTRIGNNADDLVLPEDQDALELDLSNEQE